MILLSDAVMLRVPLLLVSIIAIPHELASATTDTVPVHGVWSVCDESSCKCGDSLHDVVVCSGENLLIQPCYCMYYDQTENITIVGDCMYTCYYVNSENTGNYHYSIKHYSVDNASTFNEGICGSLISYRTTNREGRFCGRCEEGYGLAAYSYHYTRCVPCTEYGLKSWLRYFAVALLPLTLFYFLVVFFQINVTTSHLNGVVFAIQCIGSPLQLRIVEGYLSRLTYDNAFQFPKKFQGLQSVVVFSSVLGIVNLDFFRMMYPYFCLHPKMNALHIISLDFVVALYPFCLIFLTYIFVTLHDNHYRLIVWVWRPFKWCLNRYHSNFNVKSSLVETLATFILLSSVKILVACFDLMISTTVYGVNGKKLPQLFYYYDANIRYFGHEHLPFAILALILGLLFVVLPLLLLIIYPCSCFHKCLNLFGWQCQALHVFMDAFQGSYKTEPQDLRYFSAYYIILRFMVCFLTEYFASIFHIPALSFLMIIGAIFFAAFQPYKRMSHNKSDIISTLLVALFYLGYTADIIASYLDIHSLVSAQIMFLGSVVVLTFYFAFLILPLKKFKALALKVMKYRKTAENVMVDPLVEEIDRNIIEATEPRINHYTPLLKSASIK